MVVGVSEVSAPNTMILMLFAFLSVAAISDILSHKIPNYLILSGVCIGLTASAIFYGVTGFYLSAGSMLIGFIVFFPMYMFGGMSAGDVKLMAMVGCFMSPAGVLWAAFFSLMIGAVVGLGWVAVHGQIGVILRRYWLMIVFKDYVGPAKGEVAEQRFPYSIPVVLGVIVSVFWWVPVELSSR